MDSSNVCKDGQTSTCRSMDKSEMCRIQRREAEQKISLMCNTNDCKFFGIHDTNPMPDYPCRKKGIKDEDPNRNSLGSPVGMVASSINFKSEGKPSDLGLVRFATYLKALGRLYLNPEIAWSSPLLDELIREGLALMSISEKQENKLESPSEIYSDSEKKICREFKLADCDFHVELMQKFKFESDTQVSGPQGDMGGRQEEDVHVVYLKPALRKFFRHHKHCLLTFGTSIYLMIWRSCGAYFVLDFCGRKLDFNADREKGMAMLICLRTLENVRHLVVGLTNLPKDYCSLREMKVVKVVLPSGDIMQRDYGNRVHEYVVVTDDYAYLKASLHLTLNKDDFLRNRSALPAGVAAIVASKIDHPATWNMKMLDKLLCFGVSFCQACWMKCMATNDILDIKEFPTVFNMGQFTIEINMNPHKYEGTWRCVPGYGQSELTQALEKAFKEGEKRLLLQISYQVYAIWKKQNFLYLLDPYRHRIMGQAGESEISKGMEKSATVRMFRSFEVLMNILNSILLDSNRSSSFYIHTLEIKAIEMRDKKVPKNLRHGVPTKVKSLNEHICFEQTDDFCTKVLGDISDYEDEDLVSEVDELELKTSSSEGEEDLDEEEDVTGGAGEEEEIEGLESSSSGEDQEIQKSGKGKGKRKTKKSNKSEKGNKKGGKGKEKKGDGANDDDNEQEKAKGESQDRDDGKKDHKKAAKEDKNTKGGKKKTDKDKGHDKDDETKNTESQKRKTGKDKHELDPTTKETEDVLKSQKDLNANKENKIEGKIEEKPEETAKSDKENIEDKDKFPLTHNFTKPPQMTPTQSPPPPRNVMADKQVEVNLIDTLSPKGASAKHQRSHKKCLRDGTEADDEADDENFLKKMQIFCPAFNPNRYPGYYKCPLDMAVVGSENGSYQSLCKLLNAGFKRADRILAMTPFGNFVIFRCHKKEQNHERQYYLYDGCTCNVNRFRHLDLTIGTAGLLCFKQLHDIIEYMRKIRKIRSKENRCHQLRLTADDICRQYC
ncbi:uncharacterized protein LOC142221981 [Haematobia irritans]|uniref:uncharacterized protein LOC142221981 n=1 Tax=Haematobia irritans TaxID=7368 RepID=UPI003F4FA154